MKEFIILFVVMTPGSNEIGFMTKEMAGPYYPSNKIGDILELVKKANEVEEDKNTLFVDVFGIYIEDRLEYWEVISE